MEFETTMNAGCRFCHLICDVLQLLLSTHTHSTSGAKFILRTSPSDGPVELNSLDFLHNGAALELYIASNETSDWGDIIWLPEVSAAGGSEEASQFIGRHLIECLADHENCRFSFTALPTRLLSVGYPAEPIQLIASGNATSSKYAALSHCWGDKRSIELTTTNEGELVGGISLESLPRCYQDAFTICRRLDIPYLWIDSMCIRQDDEHDWDDEASKMADIYENSFLTICASRTQNAEESFLSPRTRKSKSSILRCAEDQSPLI